MTTLARIETGLPAENLAAFSRTFAKARSSWAGSPRRSGRSRSIESWKVPLGWPVCSTASCSTSSIEQTAAPGSDVARPGAARGRAASRSAARASWPRRGRPRGPRRRSRRRATGSSASAAVRIAVTGVRRSWETERRTAVFISSLRRSASVSTSTACSAARCIAAARIDSSDGTTRSRTRALSASESSRAAAAPDRPVGSTQSSIADHRDLRGASIGRRSRTISAPRRPDRLGETLGSEGQRILEPVGTQQQLGDLAGEVRLATALIGLQRPRAGQLGQQADRRRDRDEGREADPVAAVRKREVANRREMEEGERGRAQDGRARRRRRAPRRPTRRPRPAGRSGPSESTGATFFKRVDQARRGGHARQRDEHAQQRRGTPGAELQRGWYVRWSCAAT